jgi:cysteine desulfurase
MTLYLDHNATTPPAASVLQAMLEGSLTHWANPSSTHAMGQDARQALSGARAKVAAWLGCKPNELVFTSGATEANQIALRGAVGRQGRRGLVLSRGEHAASRKLAQHLADQHGVPVGWMGLLPDGSLDMAQSRSLITPEVSLVSLMAANNETGVLMPIQQVADWAHAQGALLHVDATQWVGKLPFDFASTGADLVSLSAHKFGGPKGVGALIIKQGVSWPALFQGSQERARRGGTENLPGIIGLATAAELNTHTPQAWASQTSRLAALRDHLAQGLCAAMPATVVYGQSQPRLPNTLFLRFGRLHADLVLQRLERLGVMASSGSACSSSGNEPSAVLTAMDVPRDEALCAVRLSLPPHFSVDQVEWLLQHLPMEFAPLLVDAPFNESHLETASGVTA